MSKPKLLIETMPTAAPRPCTKPGCGVLVRDGSGRCQAHQREAWGRRPDAPQRITGRRRQVLREQLLRREPLCAECSRHGRVSLAVERDHIVPLTEGGQDTEDNVQGLCKPCHEEKSLGERLRAQRRARGQG